MKGLYDRDFTVLAPEEEQEKERIDAEENAARKLSLAGKICFTTIRKLSGVITPAFFRITLWISCC